MKDEVFNKIIKNFKQKLSYFGVMVSRHGHNTFILNMSDSEIMGFIQETLTVKKSK